MGRENAAVVVVITQLFKNSKSKQDMNYNISYGFEARSRSPTKMMLRLSAAGSNSVEMERDPVMRTEASECFRDGGSRVSAVTSDVDSKNETIISKDQSTNKESSKDIRDLISSCTPSLFSFRRINDDIFIAILQNQYEPKDENLTCCSFLGPNFWSLLDDIEEGQEHVKLRELAPFSWLASNNTTLYALRPPPVFPPPLI